MPRPVRLRVDGLEDRVTPATPSIVNVVFASKVVVAAAAAATTYSTAAQSVTLAANVTSGGATNVLDGMVKFTLINGSTTVGTSVTAPVADGVAQAAYALPAGQPVGSYTITATYSKLGSDSGRSSTNTLAIAKAPTTATVNNLGVAPGTTTVPLTGLALQSPAGIVDAGTVTVTVRSGSTVIGSPVVANANALNGVVYTLPSGTAAGTYSLSVNYSGSANFLSTNDATHTLTVSTPGATSGATHLATPSVAGTVGGTVLTVNGLQVLTSSNVPVTTGQIQVTIYTFTGTTMTVIGTPVIVDATASSLVYPASVVPGFVIVREDYLGSNEYATSNLWTMFQYTNPTNTWTIQTWGGSGDPNDLVGPAGAGPRHLRSAAADWPYQVVFANDGTGAAGHVTVTAQLDPNLDPSTFHFVGAGFGPIRIVVPANQASYHAVVPYHTAAGLPIDVDVNFNFDRTTGRMQAKFDVVAPTVDSTSLPYFGGFLPPDNAAHDGLGYLTFAARPLATDKTGTVIAQKATVVFDTNAPQDTPTATNTVFAGQNSASLLDGLSIPLLASATKQAKVAAMAPTYSARPVPAARPMSWLASGHRPATKLSIGMPTFNLGVSVDSLGL